MTIKDKIDSLGTTDSAKKINEAYDFLIAEMNRTDFKDTQSRFEVEMTLNHITNYNLVRVANKALEDYDSSCKTDKTRLDEIRLCLDSIKDHEDNEVEKGLLRNLCYELQIL